MYAWETLYMIMMNTRSKGGEFEEAHSSTTVALLEKPNREDLLAKNII